jgi:Flp pilus assembly protein CpaB
VGAIWATGVIDLSSLGFGQRPPDRRGMVAIPVSAAPIPAYTKMTRDHLWNPRTSSFAVLYLRPEQVPREVLQSMNQLVGRVLDHDKPAGYVFTDSDFLPAGTRPGLVAGIPAGKCAMRVEAEKINGLIGLNPGDRFDLVSTLTIDAGRASIAGGPYSQQLEMQARLSNWQKQATVRVLVQSGLVVEPLTTRQVPVVSSGLVSGLTVRTRPVQEIVIAVDPDEVAHLTEAMAVGAQLSCVPRSGRPDDPPDSVTPNLSPWSPFGGAATPPGYANSQTGGAQPAAPGGFGPGPLTTIESISGTKREVLATPIKR